jgi:4-hydroxyproline epimerase
METPAGLVLISYKQEGRKVKSVRLINVPAYLAAEDIEVECPDLGILRLDISYGGNFYAIIDIQKNFKGLENYSVNQLISWSPIIRSRINKENKFIHPVDPTINGCSHILWTGAVLDKGSTARNAVFYGEKAIDRSPCGTGTSARMAQWYAKGKLRKGEQFIHESIIGSKFTGTIEEELRAGRGYMAIILFQLIAKMILLLMGSRSCKRWELQKLNIGYYAINFKIWYYGRHSVWEPVSGQGANFIGKTGTH